LTCGYECVILYTNGETVRIQPENNWILVELVKAPEEKKESMVLLPEDFKAKESPYSVVKVIRDSTNEAASFKKDELLVIPTHIIRDIQVESHSFSLIERNHIMASMREEN